VFEKWQGLGLEQLFAVARFHFEEQLFGIYFSKICGIVCNQGFYVLKLG